MSIEISFSIQRVIDVKFITFIFGSLSYIPSTTIATSVSIFVISIISLPILSTLSKSIPNHFFDKASPLNLNNTLLNFIIPPFQKKETSNLFTYLLSTLSVSLVYYFYNYFYFVLIFSKSI